MFVQPLYFIKEFKIFRELRVVDALLFHTLLQISAWVLKNNLFLTDFGITNEFFNKISLYLDAILNPAKKFWVRLLCPGIDGFIESAQFFYKYETILHIFQIFTRFI